VISAGTPRTSSPRALATLIASAAALALVWLPAPAGAAPGPPEDLTVLSGEGPWQAETRFVLEWSNPPAAAGVRYLVRDPQGGIAVPETRLGWAATRATLKVPKAPGAYTAELRLEDAGGAIGPAASAMLRFDDTRPGPVEPLAIPEWIGRTAFPLTVRLSRPAGPLPLSGIRGYGVSVDPLPGARPCLGNDRCTVAETTLRDGVAGDSLTLPGLPEGTSHLHAVAVSGAGMASTVTGEATLRVDTTDPVTRLAGAPSGWVSGPVRLTATATDAGSGMGTGGEGPAPFTAIRIDGAAPTVAPGATVNATVIGEGAHRVAHFARDRAGNVNDGGHTNGLANQPPALAWVRIDRSPPLAAFANAPDPSRPESIRVEIRDRLSGPEPARGWIGVRPAGSDDRFEPLPAEPPAPGLLRARWDSDAFPPGHYEFRATAFDSAGNSAIATRRVDGAPMVLANPLKATTTLRSGFRGGPASRTVPYGRSVAVTGRLTAGMWASLQGAPLRIVEHFAGGARPASRVTEVRTNRSGAFALRLSPGPSREVTAVFAGGPALTRSSGPALRLAVRSGVRLRVSAARAEVGGAPLVFSGRVLAPPGTIPPGGRAVELQFRLPGLAWGEFRTVKTDRRGRFSYPYRFSDDDSRGVRFQFRAFVPTQSDWPYEPGGSRPVAVEGV
jgi:hypothetical protein